MAYFESLPYIDPEPSPEALSAARALITAEQAKLRPNPLPALHETRFSPLVTAQLSAIATGQPSQKLDLSRYESQDLPPSGTDATALRTPLSNASISSEYLASRSQNLDLLSSHGKNAWLMGNYLLEAELKSLERDLTATKRDIDLLNVARAESQNSVKAEMLSLQHNWRSALGRVVETEIAVEQLKAEIREELKSKSADGPPVSPPS